MRMSQLLAPAILVSLAVAACSRSEVDTHAERANQQVRAAAGRAGEQIADSWLTTKIQAQYFADDDIKARQINVSTRDSAVTLTGYVDHEAQRDLAVQIALMTDGVRQVNDRLTVGAHAGEDGAAATSGTESSSADTDPPGASADTLVTTRIQSKFFLDDRVKGRRIIVETRNGVVMLSGEVADESERARALLLARTTDGVSRVEDLLTVMPAPSQAPTVGMSPVDADAAVKTAIQARYFVDPAVKASAIDVSSRNGAVTLEGKVESDAIRTQALAIAQSTPGVTQVIDRLTVTSRTR